MDNEIKQEFKQLRQFLIENMVTKDDVAEIKTDIRNIKKQLNVLHTSMDSFAKQHIDKSQESTIGAYHFHRIEKWIKKAANKIGIEYNS